MSTPERWLAVVGIGDDGPASLTSAGRALIEQAEVLVGGSRHLGWFADHPALKLPWARPFEDSFARIEAQRGRPVVVLATGDPMCFGAGTRLARRFGIDVMTIVPSPSAFSLACARLGWSLPDTACVTLHGRPADALRMHLAPGLRLLALSWDGSTPACVARILTEAGYGGSWMAALEHLGGPDERRIEGVAQTWTHPPGADLNIVAIVCALDRGRLPRPCAPGLPDDAFRHDGKLTKREVRAATLARLMPLPGQRLWDVGAGSGAVAIEWLRASGTGRAIAIERAPARIADLAANAAALGVPQLEIHQGTAPACLEGLAPPDAIFIGGGLASPGMLEACADALSAGGRLVANAVTLQAERVLLEAHSRLGGELVRLAVSRAEPVGGFTGWRPLMAVTQFAWIKP